MKVAPERGNVMLILVSETSQILRDEPRVTDACHAIWCVPRRRLGLVGMSVG